MSRRAARAELGWHFCAMHDGHPVLRDGSSLVLRHTYEHPGPLRLCESGYHDSERVIDALMYASGSYLSRTLVSGDVSGSDKRVSRYRIALAGCDATMTLHRFAVRIAYCALLAEREAGREPTPESWDAVRTKMRWCDGEATDEELVAARDVASRRVTRAPTRSWAWSTPWAASAAASAAGHEAAAAAAAAARVAIKASAAAEARVWDAAEEMLLGMLPSEAVNPPDAPGDWR